jgi:precorrin-6Y C5,15-methyltransferase (decarboxylating)
MKTDAERPPLVVIGMLADGMNSLPLPAARELFRADVIFTSARLASLLPGDLQPRVRTWPRPFSVLGEEITALRKEGQRVAVVLTGSPFWFGAGPLLARYVPPAEMRVYPAPSAFSLAAARLGWPLQDVCTLSLHGRRSLCIERHMLPGVRMLIIGQDGTTPLTVARRLVARGYGRSHLVVLSHMGTDNERREEGRASEIAAAARDDFPAFHMLAVEVVPDDEDTPVWPLAPGLPDEAYAHDGQLTKREVRAVTVSALQPRPHAVMWDVGAGCGSVAIEWQRIAGPLARSFAVEASEERCRLIERNANSLGALGLKVVCGRAPAALKGLPAPDAVFIGGDTRSEDVFETCLEALRPGGVLVANAVSLEGETALMRRHDRHGGELVRLSVERAAPLGGTRAFRPAMPVTQLRIRKRSRAA